MEDFKIEGLPNQIRVGPYQVILMVMDSHEATVAFGKFSAMMMEIKIEANFKSAIKALDTLLHEICHAIFWAYDIHEKEDDEERIVMTMGKAWAQIYMDNPKLLDWINRTSAKCREQNG